jgi:hypothetical protein
MASKTSADPKEPGRVRRLSDLARDIAARRAEIGLVAVPRNSGKRRTPSKRALLKAIAETGGRW